MNFGTLIQSITFCLNTGVPIKPIYINIYMVCIYTHTYIHTRIEKIGTSNCNEIYCALPNCS